METAAAKGAAFQVSLISMFMFTKQTLVFTKCFVKRRFLGGCILNVSEEAFFEGLHLKF